MTRLNERSGRCGRGAPKLISGAIFGKDSQVIRIGFNLALREISDFPGHIPIGATSSEIKEAARRVMPDVLNKVAYYALLKLGATEEPAQKIIHEAVYSKNTFRPAIGRSGQDFKPAYRSGTDRIAVGQARAKRRCYLMREIIFELEAALRRGYAAELRRTVIERLIETDLLELDWREDKTEEQNHITEQLDLHRQRVLVEMLGVDITDFMAACKYFIKNHPERPACTEKQITQFAVTKYLDGEQVPFLQINRKALESLDGILDCELLMPQRLVDLGSNSQRVNVDLLSVSTS